MSLMDLSWSPNHDSRFFVFCQNNLFLFHITDLDYLSALPAENGSVIGNKCKFFLQLLNVHRKLDGIKACAWQPCLNAKHHNPVSPSCLVALGSGLGDIKLKSLEDIVPQQDQFCLNNKDLFSRSNRCCTFLAWNPWKTNLLAQGLERGRSNREPSILIWDVVNSTGSNQSSGNFFPPTGFPSTPSIPELANSNHPAEMLLNYGQPVNSVFGLDKTSNSPVAMYCNRPLCDACHNENVNSFAWLSKGSFIAGVMGKCLKVYDISDPSRVCQITQTRLVNGLTVDPLFSSRIASFFQHQIALWRVDNLEKPVYTFTETRNVLCIKWSPLSEGWLGVLLADSTFVKVFNTQLPFSQPMEESEQSLLELRAMCSREPESPLVSFVWHATVVNCIIAIDQTGCFNVAQVNERPTVGWTCNQTLIWSSGPYWLSFNRLGLSGSAGNVIRTASTHALPPVTPPLTAVVVSSAISNLATAVPSEQISAAIANHVTELVELFECDIAAVMRKRAVMGYGLGMEPVKYSDIVADDGQLRSMWIWIQYLQTYIDARASFNKLDDYGMIGSSTAAAANLAPATRAAIRCQGAVTILCGETSGASEMIEQPEWKGIDAHLSFPRYHSSGRSRVLRLCMWPLNEPTEVTRLVFKSVCDAFEFERAAAMALINLNFDWALSFLNRAPKARQNLLQGQNAAPQVHETDTSQSASETDLVALALAGFSDPCNPLWRNTCADLSARLKDPYLRVMLNFLMCRGGDFKGILENEDLRLIDRLAFACLYLNDDDLRQFVCTTCNRMVKAGRLDAVLLTGLVSADFIDLVQHYLNRTGDVQTAAIVGLHACALSTPSGSQASVATQRLLAGTAAATYSTVGRYPSASTVSAPSPAQLMATAANPLSSTMRLRQRATDKEATAQSAESITQGVSVVQLGGRRLANWIHSYRDLLDRWRMWFHRADFDNYYRSRLVAHFVVSTAASTASATSRPSVPPTPQPTPAYRAEDPNTSAESTSTGTSHATDPSFAVFVSDEGASARAAAPKPTAPSVTRIRTVGLPAAASQIFVACTFCGWRLGNVVRSTQRLPSGLGSGLPRLSTASTMTMSVSAATTEAPHSTAGTGDLQMHGGGGKQTICWHCRKPLPRCSICLMHLGSVIGSESTTPTAIAADLPGGRLRTDLSPSARLKTGPVRPPKSLSEDIRGNGGTVLPVSSWFVWCQACRHGGHAGHLSEWFYGGGGSDYSGRGGRTGSIPVNLIECPVNGCTCRCASLDAKQPEPAVSFNDFPALPHDSQLWRGDSVKERRAAPAGEGELDAATTAAARDDYSPFYGYDEENEDDDDEDDDEADVGEYDCGGGGINNRHHDYDRAFSTPPENGGTVPVGAEDRTAVRALVDPVVGLLGLAAQQSGRNVTEGLAFEVTSAKTVPFSILQSVLKSN
uniref:MIOS-like alpha-solenoid domain-containing protein n=2 Tax=Schistocephalus solidus TaxID=70667 RepID=A0A0X3PQ69_SCHSO